MTTLDKLLFSCEFLTPADMVRRKAVDVIADTGTMVCLRTLYKDLEDPSFTAMLDAFKDRGIGQSFLPWPMLDVKDGYYANEITVDKFAALVKRVLDWYCDHGYEIPQGIIVDLEPCTDPEEARKAEQVRLEGKKEEPKKKDFDIMSFVGKLVDGIDENVNPERFEAAAVKFGEMQDMMHGYGTKAIAVALPMAYEDIFDNRLLIQDFMTCPVTNVNWDMINFMIFNTDYVAATKGIITNEEYRHLLYAYGKEFVQKWGAEKSSITLGITNVGIADTRAVQRDPELYRLEVGALLAAGMTNVGIYALDGVLDLPDPRVWIETVKAGKASDFTPDPEKLETAAMVRRAFQALDYAAPILKHLVDTGKVMDIIRAFASK